MGFKLTMRYLPANDLIQSDSDPLSLLLDFISNQEVQLVVGTMNPLDPLNQRLISLKITALPSVEFHLID